MAAGRSAARLSAPRGKALPRGPWAVQLCAVWKRFRAVPSRLEKTVDVRGRFAAACCRAADAAVASVLRRKKSSSFFFFSSPYLLVCDTRTAVGGCTLWKMMQRINPAAVPRGIRTDLNINTRFLSSQCTRGQV